MSTLEKHIEAYLVNAVEARGGYCLKLEVKGRRGWPDRLCILPAGCLFFVEVKKRGGRVSPRQKHLAKVLGHLGHRHFFVWDKQEVDALMRRMEIECMTT